MKSEKVKEAAELLAKLYAARGLRKQLDKGLGHNLYLASSQGECALEHNFEIADAVLAKRLLDLTIAELQNQLRALGLTDV